MNFDRIMTIFLYKSAQVLLLFYCLTPTDIECTQWGLTDADKPEVIEFKKIHSSESYALITRSNQRESPICGAVWFSDHFLLTSASCLTRNYDLIRAPYIEVTVFKWTEKEKDLPKKKNLLKKLQEKLPGQKKSDQSIANAAQIYVVPEGEAIVHPLYKMNEDGLSFGYDLAVVRVNVAGRKTAKLCSEDSTASRWIIFTGQFSRRPFLKRYEYHVYHQAQPNFTALANNSRTMQWYYIDPHKQFTTYSSNQDLGKHQDGDPLFDFEKNCVAGIKNFGGVTNKKTQFITSTKVYPVKEWIEHTRQYLINLNKKHPQTVGPLNADKSQPGNILTSKVNIRKIWE